MRIIGTHASNIRGVDPLEKDSGTLGQYVSRINVITRFNEYVFR